MKKPGLTDVVISVLMLFAAYWLTTKMAGLSSLKNIFKIEKVVIDQTPIIIKNIKSIAQLVTITSYDEVVVDSVVYNRSTAIFNAFKVLSAFRILPSMQKQLVIVGKGKILAGIDLLQINDSSLHLKGDTAILQLPPANILDIITNPSDFETFEEKGQWTSEEVISVKLRVRERLRQRAMQQNILLKATNKAKHVMQNLLHNSGYKVAIIQTRVAYR